MTRRLPLLAGLLFGVAAGYFLDPAGAAAAVAVLAGCGLLWLGPPR